jgi:serine/threonine protein kinase
LTLTAGTRLGVYAITAQIGEGGMGQVFRATDTKLKRPAAIKILPPSLAADQDRLARFQREAEVLLARTSPTPLANVLKMEPEWKQLPADLPARIRHGLRACLQKHTKQRIATCRTSV